MSDLPVISVVTPSFNQGQFLEQTLRSVLDQGYPNLEYVVIDGGSTDDSQEIISKYADRLNYWVSEPDSGHADAINKGFAKTTGDIMCWINSDDKFLPWTLQTVAEIFDSNPEIEWIHGIPSSYDEKGRMFETKPTLKNKLDFALGKYQWIQQESVFWRRSLWERAGGTMNTDYRFMVDGELWSRFFSHAELVHVQCVLSGLRHHGTRRAPENMKKVLSEMDQCSAEMFERDGLSSQLDGFQAEIERRKSRYIRSRRSLSVLPYKLAEPRIQKLTAEYFDDLQSLLEKVFGTEMTQYQLLKWHDGWKKESKPYYSINRRV